MQATVTGMNNVTANLGVLYTFCGAYSYSVDQVLLPATDYRTTPTDCISSACAAGNHAVVFLLKKP